MPARTTGSIEFKLSNISAVLEEVHEPWIDGYKPYHNYQGALRTAVLIESPYHRVGEVMAEYVANSLPAPTRSPRATEDILSRLHRSPDGNADVDGITTGAFGALRDLQNRQLGRAGEEFVLEAERQSLSRHGRRDLADRIEWVADVRGDGAGYDIASFRPDG